MAYATGSLNCDFPRVGSGDDAGSLSSAQWCYVSDDAVATVIAAAYIDDAFDKGLKVDDRVVVIDSTGSSETIDYCLVTVVDTSTNASGDATLIQLA